MKKDLKILTIVLIFAVAISLFACKDKDDDKPPKNGSQTPTFYDMSDVVYSADYYNPDEPEEKGFIIGDSIDLNKIKFNIEYTADPIFHIYYEDMAEPITTIEKEGNSYPTYKFEVPGGYAILIVLPQTAGAASAREAVNVRMCGVPEERYFLIKDASGKTVTDIFVGSNYTITALLYSDGILIDEKDDRYTLYWSDAPEGITLSFSPTTAGNNSLVFNYTFIRSGGQKYTGTAEYVFTVYPEQ